MTSPTRLIALLAFAPLQLVPANALLRRRTAPKGTWIVNRPSMSVWTPRTDPMIDTCASAIFWLRSALDTVPVI